MLCDPVLAERILLDPNDVPADGIDEPDNEQCFSSRLCS